MIYFVQCETTRLVKIGWFLRDLKSRLHDVRQGPTRVRLLSLLPGFHKEERMWHERFVEKRVIGEWFALDDADIPSTTQDVRPFAQRTWCAKPCRRCGRAKWSVAGARSKPLCGCPPRERGKQDAERIAASVARGTYMGRRSRGETHNEALLQHRRGRPPGVQPGSIRAQCIEAGVAYPTYMHRRARGSSHEEALTLSRWQRAKRFTCSDCARPCMREGGRCTVCCDKRSKRGWLKRRRQSTGLRISHLQRAACDAIGLNPHTYEGRRRRGLSHVAALALGVRAPGRPRNA